ncbi:MAG TPA: DUF2975 domain-containing protein [Ramlibacter sp.]|jgi:hypothetical protein
MDRLDSAALPIAHTVLRILIVLNWLFGAGILVLLVAMIVARDWTFAALGVPPGATLPPVVFGLRSIAALGWVAIPLNHVVLSRLLAMVNTVRGRDPFAAANADRLLAVAWALLALQVLGMAIGTIGKAVSAYVHPLHLDAGFSVSGWLAVLLAFILARVFAEATHMRDDLEGTV